MIPAQDQVDLALPPPCRVRWAAPWPVLLAPPGVRRTPPHRPAGRWRGLQAAERTWVRALEGGDVALLERLVDSELSFIGPDGEFEDRAAYLAGYRALPRRASRSRRSNSTR